METKEGTEERTFRVNFSPEGVKKLRETVTEKLKEFMGEYTDDTLVEYVIVLLKNGRRKDEAKNELDVFLGDDSVPFVTWLWDHLASNIDKYVLSTESRPEEVQKSRPARVEHAAKKISHDKEAASDREKYEKLPKTQSTRVWKDAVRNVVQPPPVHTSDLEDTFKESKLHTQKESKLHTQTRSSRHSISPDPASRRKRSYPEERTRSKEAASRISMNAPKRLLQFAVRDAVATTGPSHSLSEPALKRLRSVVSSSIVDSTSELHSQRLHSVARVPNTFATAIRSVAEAAEDVIKKYKPSGNVFDRLSRGVDAGENSRQLSNLRSAVDVDVDGYDDFDQTHEGTHEMDHQTNVHGSKYVGTTSMMDSDTGLASDSASDNEGYDAFNVVSRGVQNVPKIGTSGRNKNDDSVMVQYSVAPAPNTETLPLPSRSRDPDPSVANTRKIVNISVNVNTWKPTHYQSSVEMMKGPESQKSLQPVVTAAGKSTGQFMKENSGPLTVNKNVKPVMEGPNEERKTLPSAPESYSMGRPLEDVDSRTIFVTNVHFAATKDSLSRHFNKFGEVLKVIILVDPSTGLPKGSAYIEFMRKEAAENALSLDGTSFMSRILKVVRKGATHQEASSLLSRPQVARGSPFAVTRFTRAPFPRAFPGAFRARPLIKSGARSMQWKRDSQPSTVLAASSTSGTGPSPSPRGLTYVRPELKTDANPGAA